VLRVVFILVLTIPSFSSRRVQVWRYFSDRTGIIAYYNLPLVFLMGTRNNLFIWLTGWSFSTFNVFHRWVARVFVLQGFLHSVGYTVDIFYDGGLAEYQSYWVDGDWFYTGVMVILLKRPFTSLTGDRVQYSHAYSFLYRCIGFAVVSMRCFCESILCLLLVLLHHSGCKYI
jgi:hypothetical protein